MSILNYFFIGFAFTFIVDYILSLESIKNHPKLKNQKSPQNKTGSCFDHGVGLTWKKTEISQEIMFNLRSRRQEL